MGNVEELVKAMTSATVLELERVEEQLSRHIMEVQNSINRLAALHNELDKRVAKLEHRVSFTPQCSDPHTL